MKIPFLSRLMEIKEEQLGNEKIRLRFLLEDNILLENILKELKGGLKK